MTKQQFYCVGETLRPTSHSLNSQDIQELEGLNYNYNANNLNSKDNSHSLTSSSSTTHEKLSQVLHAKLCKSNKVPLASLTCLRLDVENSHIGVWQKRAGPSPSSKWVKTVKFEKNKNIIKVDIDHEENNKEQEGQKGEKSMPIEAFGRIHDHVWMDEVEKLALQLIEELLSRNHCSFL